MFRANTDAAPDPKLETLLAEISREVFGSDEERLKLSFDEIEKRSHQVGRRVARRMTETALADQAHASLPPHLCPHCQGPADAKVQARDLQTRDGTISLQEVRCFCPRCRRAFFPRATTPAADPQSL